MGVVERIDVLMCGRWNELSYLVSVERDCLISSLFDANKAGADEVVPMLLLTVT